MKTVKESLNSARELVAYLGYYNRYLEDLKKSFMQGRNVEYDNFGDSHIFSHRIHTRKSPRCELSTTLSMCRVGKDISCDRWNYMLLVTLNYREDNYIPVSFISNCFKLDEQSEQKYKIHIEEKQREGGKWKFSTKIEGVDIPKMLMSYQAYALFYDEISRNLFFFHNEIEKR